MKVAFDAQHTVGTATGIGEYSAGLAFALEDAGVQIARLREPRVDPWRFDRRVVWDQVLFPLYARRSGADLMHCTSGSVPLVRGMPCVATVHDVAWLRVQQHTRWYARAYFGTFSLATYQRVERIVVDSAFSASELLAAAPIDPARVVVAYPGVARDFATLERSPADEAFILAVGTVEPRKNLAIVIRALAGLPHVRLISVGPPTPYRDGCAALARELGVEDRVEFRGYVDRAMLLALYAGATIAVAPSTYEGFGYAAAQALCSGTPLIASNAASLPEVVAGDAPLLDPHNATAWRDTIETMLSDRNAAEHHARTVRPQAVQRLNWDATARTMITIYRDALTTRL